MNYERIVKAGRVVTGGREQKLDIGIADGRIVALGADLTAGTGTQVIDASGLVVLPGLVDVHVHLRDPGFTHKEDFYSGTCAAAASGITTVVAQPNTDPAITTVAIFDDVRRIGEANAIVDFGITAAATETNLAELPGLVAAGAISLDFALGGSSPALTVRSNAALVAILDAVAKAGAIATAYTADADIGGAAKDALIAAGRKDPMAFADAYPASTEVVGAARLLAAAAMTGARVHIRQISCPPTVDLAMAMKETLAPGQLTIEVTPHHLYLDRSAIADLGVLAVMGPPLRSASEAAEMRAALAAGDIDIVCTDHAPHGKDEKLAAGGDVWKCPPGTPGLETMLPALLAAVHRGDMTLADLARVACERPAEIFGLAPAKGAIRIGADADLVIVDPNAVHPIDADRYYTKAKYSPFSAPLRGKVHWTLVRGAIAFDGSRVGAEAIRAGRGSGRFVAPAR